MSSRSRERCLKCLGVARAPVMAPLVSTTMHTPLSVPMLKELHAVQMERVRGGHATPGEFHRSQNWIGPPGCTLANDMYVPPPREELMNFLGDWEQSLRDRSLPPLVHAAFIHYQFEAIHQFLDDNGRVWWLLITLLLVERDILPTPLLYVSAFF